MKAHRLRGRQEMEQTRSSLTWAKLQDKGPSHCTLNLKITLRNKTPCPLQSLTEFCKMQNRKMEKLHANLNSNCIFQVSLNLIQLFSISYKVYYIWHRGIPFTGASTE